MIRRLSLIVSLAAVLAPSASAVTKNKSFPLYSFSKGVDTYHSPLSLQDGYVQNALNVLFDDLAPASKRLGFSVAWSTKSYSYTGLWTYTDSSNTTWQLARSSDQISASNLAGSVVKVATVSVNNIVGETNAGGSAYFVDQTQGVYYWNGTSTTYVSGSPLGSIITSFHGRLWVTGLAVPYGNQLYGSGYFALNTWTTGLNATDPVQYSVGLQDNFDNLTSEYVYLDTLYLFKHASIYALYGFDQTNFQISQLTQECGCIDGGTIQTYNSALEFVSLRGLESFNGYSCKRISDPVKNLVDPAIQTGSFSQQSWVQSTQTDWQAGTLNQTSALISPPSVVLSTGVVQDSSTFQFSQVTSLTNIDTTTVANTFTLRSYIADTFSNFNNWTSFTNATYTSSMIASGNSATCSASNSTCAARSNSGTISNDFLVQFTANRGDYSGSYADICAINNSDQGYCLEVNYANQVNLFEENTFANHNAVGTTPFPLCSISISGNPALSMERNSSTNVLTVYVNGASACSVTNSDVTSFTKVGISLFTSIAGHSAFSITSAYSISRTGNFNSRAIPSGYSSSTGAFGTFSVTTSGSGSSTFSTRTSASAASGYSADLSVTNGQTISSSPNNYIVYSSSLTSLGNATSLPSVSLVSINTEASSGTFKSQIHNSGSVSSWGNFSVTDSLNNGNIVFSICSSSNSNMGPPTSCATQTPNSQINVATGAATGTYVQWWSTFTVTAATQTPTLNSGTVQWFSGNKAIPMASAIWDNRYWLALTTNTADSGNDAVIVLNKTGACSVFVIHAGGFTQYKNSLYHADSLGSGSIYLDNQGYADNGNSINAFIRTKTQSMGDLTSDDYFYALYPSAVSTGNCPMTVQYTVDGSTNTYSLGNVNLNEFGSLSAARLPFPVDSSHQVFGQSVDFTLGTNDSQCGWQFLGLEGLYKARPTQ